MKTFQEFLSEGTLTESVDFKSAVSMFEKEIEGKFDDKSTYKDSAGSGPKLFPTLIINKKKTKKSVEYSIAVSSMRERKSLFEGLLRSLGRKFKISSAGLKVNRGDFEGNGFDIFWITSRGSASDVSFIKNKDLKQRDFEIFTIELEESV